MTIAVLDVVVVVVIDRVTISVGVIVVGTHTVEVTVTVLKCSRGHEQHCREGEYFLLLHYFVQQCSRLVLSYVNTAAAGAVGWWLVAAPYPLLPPSNPCHQPALRHHPQATPPSLFSVSSRPQIVSDASGNGILVRFW